MLSLRSKLFFQSYAFYSKSKLNNDFVLNEDLSRQCDACGKAIGGGSQHCPRCKIYLCFYFGTQLMLSSKEYPLRCPMCNEKMEWQEAMPVLFHMLSRKSNRFQKACKLGCKLVNFVTVQIPQLSSVFSVKPYGR